MLSPSYAISPKDLWNAIATQDAPRIVDMRRREAYAQSPPLLPGALWLAGDDDHGLLQRGFLAYDALFAWLRFAAKERHNWPAKAA